MKVHLKKCTSCKTEKPLSEFHRFPSGKFGVRPTCKLCRKTEAAEYYQKERDRILERNRQWASENPDKESARHKTWREKNIGKARKTSRDHQRRRRATTKGRLESSISSAVRSSITRGTKFGRSTFELLGYTSEQLKNHLEALFQPGMTWENYGKDGWEIDHIVPLSAHNYQTPDDIDFKKAWSLSNLQPLWMPENRSKHAKLAKPFQPSFALPANDNQRNKKEYA